MQGSAEAFHLAEAIFFCGCFKLRERSDAKLLMHPEYGRVEIAGDFRRGCELVADLALVAETKHRENNEESSGGLRLTLTDKKHFGASLLQATGSAHIWSS